MGGGRNLEESNFGHIATDFDFIVQDSINRDAPKIQRGLTEYNSNCQNQTSKVKEDGMKQEDFGAVASTSGVARPGLDRLEGEVFSTACSDELVLPPYIESSLLEIAVQKVEEVDDLKCETESRRKLEYMETSSSSTHVKWHLLLIIAMYLCLASFVQVCSVL